MIKKIKGGEDEFVAGLGGDCWEGFVVYLGKSNSRDFTGKLYPYNNG